MARVQTSLPTGVVSTDSASMDMEKPARHHVVKGSALLHSRLLWAVVLPLSDAISFFLIFAAIYGLWMSEDYFSFFTVPRLSSAVVYVAAVLITVGVMGGYRAHGIYRTLNFAAEFILAVLVGSLIGAFLIYAVFSTRDIMISESRAVLVFGSMGFVPCAMAIRIVLDSLRERVASVQPFLVISTPDKAREFMESYSQTGLRNPLELALIGETRTLTPLHGFSRQVKLGDIDWSDLGEWYEGVVLCESPADLNSDLVEVLTRVHFGVIPVHTLNNFYAVRWRQVPTLNLNPSWMLEQNFDLAHRSYYRFIKRGFDVVVSTALLIFLAPLIVLIALAVRGDSCGPVLFTQTRVGRGGKRFTLYKFRTMEEGADKSGDPYTRKNDRRITRVGHVLRRLRLDELPQILNIWKGDMSLIGPRAEWDRLVAQYEQKIPHYHLRHLVKPGLTGWAQLNYPYGESLEDAAQKLKFDLYYIKYYSPLLDIEIVLKTMLAVLAFRGR